MTDAAWRDYVTAIMHARLSAHLRAAYFERVRRFLGGINFAIQLVVTLGSASAVVALLSSAPPALSIFLAATVAVCSGVAQVMNIAEKVQRASTLSTGWHQKGLQLDEAWVLVQSAQYLGPLHNLCGDADLAQVEEDLGFPQIDSWARAEQKRVSETDPFRSSLAA